MNTSLRPLPRRATPGRGRVLLSRALPAFLLVVLVTGCASGYVTTSTGAIVPASTVQAQDAVGDALSVLQDVHNAAVDRHDALAGQEPADVHAERRAALVASASGLRAAWDGLAAWKLGSEGAGMAAVVGKVRDALPEMLRAAVSLGVVSQGYADAIGAFISTASKGIAPEPLKKEPVRTSYFDGCNWHTPLPGGGWGITAMGCSTINANHMYVQGVPRLDMPGAATLEMRPR